MTEKSETIQILAQRVATLPCEKCGATLDVTGSPMFSVIVCPACKTSQTVPGRLSHFLLRNVLGRGGMAAVYRAFDESLSRTVAIKVMRRQLGEDPQFVENFLREARAAAQLNHRNIVQIYMVGQEKSQPYIVMELLDGGRLDELIAAGKTLSEERALRILLGISEGLKAASDIGLLHGDIKPANILFDRAHTPKLTDFGLARFHGGPAASAGEIWGTPYYIAPEKVRRQKEDFRSDIYSLGATMYHALAGQPPFEGATANDVVLARLKASPKPLAEVRGDLHKATAEVVTRMLESEPARRYPNYASLIGDLNSALDAVKSGPAVSAETAPKPRARAKGILIGALVAAALGIGLFFALRGGAKPETPPDATVTPVAPGPPAAPSLQPFSAKEQAQLGEALKKMEADDFAGAVKIWVELAKNRPADDRASAGIHWLRLFTALPEWIQGRQVSQHVNLSKVLKENFATPAGGAPHPGLMAQELACLMAERPAPPDAEKNAALWPGWYRDLRGFFAAARDLRAGKTDPGEAALAAYLAIAPPAEPAWPYQFQGLARKWKQSLADFRTERDQITARIQKGEGETVVRELTEHARAARFPLTSAAYDAPLRRAQREFADWQKQAGAPPPVAAADAGAQAAQNQAQFERVSNLRAAMKPYALRLDFDGGLTFLGRESEALTHPQARQALDDVREGFQRMKEIQTLIIQTAAARPYRMGNANVVAAMSDGVVLATGGRQTKRAWNTLDPKMFGDMGAFYIGQSGKPDADKAVLTGGLAVLAYYIGETRLTALFAERAVKLDAAQRDALSRIIPGLNTP